MEDKYHSVDVFTPEFAQRLSGIGYKNVSQCRVIVNDLSISIEELQDKFAKYLRDLANGYTQAYDFWPDPTPKRTIGEFLND